MDIQKLENMVTDIISDPESRSGKNKSDVSTEGESFTHSIYTHYVGVCVYIRMYIHTYTHTHMCMLRKYGKGLTYE